MIVLWHAAQQQQTTASPPSNPIPSVPPSIPSITRTITSQPGPDQTWTTSSPIITNSTLSMPGSPLTFSFYSSSTTSLAQDPRPASNPSLDSSEKSQRFTTAEIVGIVLSTIIGCIGIIIGFLTLRATMRKKAMKATSTRLAQGKSRSSHITYI